MENTLTNLFIEHIKERGLEKEIFYTKEDDEYISFKNEDLVRQVYNLIKFFEENNLKENDKIAIISENCVEWVVVDFACMFMKLVSIPVYTSQSLSQIKYILENSGSKICFVSNSILLEKVLKIKKDLPELEKVIAFRNINPDKYEKGSLILFQNIINENSTGTEDNFFEYLINLSSNISGRDLLTIIYTSGTTGIPKGVMLTHENVFSNVTACQKVLTINENDIFLSYLPYSHAYERTAGYYLPLFSGAKIFYAQSIDTIAKQLIEAKPTIVITVPRLLDKIYNRLLSSGEEMKEGLQKKIFLWAVDIARNKSISKDSLKWKVADKMVFKKIREKTGGNIRFFASGGGALNKTVGEFFDRIGIMILEGYGMTEASPVISVNPPGKNKYGTVGKPLQDVKIKLSDENEILINGELIMKGYYQDEVSTSEIIKEGWLYSGDIGEIDSDGYLKITDRKKSLMKTSGGKYVSPTQLEDLISGLSYVENIIVVGNERMYITALIIPDKTQLIYFANKNNIVFKSFTELIKENSLLRLIQRDIDTLQKDLANYERVRKITMIEKPFSIEGGELTPTLKIKRKFVEEKFKDEIEKMYLKI